MLRLPFPCSTQSMGAVTHLTILGYNTIPLGYVIASKYWKKKNLASKNWHYREPMYRS